MQKKGFTSSYDTNLVKATLTLLQPRLGPELASRLLLLLPATQQLLFWTNGQRRQTFCYTFFVRRQFEASFKK